VLSALHALVGWTGLVSSAILALGLARDLAASVVHQPRAAQFVMAESDVDIDLQTAAEFDGPVANLELQELADTLDPQHAAAPQGASAPSRNRGAPTLHRIYRVTAYADEGVTASGRRVGTGQCAAPIDIPFGAKVHIPALGRTFVVTDRTHPRFHHNTVDVFLPGEPLCRKFGRRYLECEVTLPRPAPRR